MESLTDPKNLETLIDRLPDFIDELRIHGYKIGVQQYIAAESLLLKLFALHSIPATLLELSPWLAPIFSTTPDEQKDFSLLFGAWLRRIFPEVPLAFSPSPQPALIERPPGVKPVTDGPSHIWHSAHRRYVMAAIVLIAIMAGILLTLFERERRSSNVNVNSASNVNSNAAGTPNMPTATGEPSPTLAGASGSQDQQFGVAYILSSYKPEEVSDSQKTATPQTWYARNFRYLSRTAVMIPLALFGIWCGWNVYNRRAQLERWNSKDKPRLDRIPVEGVQNRLFHDGSFRRLARELRRHRHLDSKRLDIKTTVKATSRRGGLFTAVYGNRRVLPEYLVLIDRVGYKDQQAQFGNEIVSRLVENDVFIDRYFFQRDPYWCRNGGPESPYHTLQDLAARHPDHHLLIFSDGEGLINPLTGDPQSWVKLFEQWRDRALLTPLPSLDWSYREWVLAHSDFTVVPANIKGMEYLCESISTGVVPKKLEPDNSMPFPALLVEEEGLWQQRHEPQQINKLCAQLKRFLGEDGYYLLGACSVYPSLQWELTLYLAFQLLDHTRIDECIAALVRLPWLRHGFIPDWLRQRLIDDLGSKREHTVRKHLQNLLLTYLQNPRRPVPLVYAAKPTLTETASLIESLGEKLTNWRQSRLLRRLIKRMPNGSLLHDKVFLNFMSGSRLALAIPEALHPYLFRRGRAELGMRVLPGLGLALLAAAMIWVAFLLSQPVEDIPPVNTSARTAAPSGLPDFKYTPLGGDGGSNLSLQVTTFDSSRTFDFSGMSVTVQPDSGVALDSATTSREQLFVPIHIAKDAKPGRAQLTVLSASGELVAYLPFEVAVPIPKPVGLASSADGGTRPPRPQPAPLTGTNSKSTTRTSNSLPAPSLPTDKEKEEAKLMNSQGMGFLNNDAPQAEKLLRQAILLDPTIGWYYDNLAVALLQQGKIKEAEDADRQAIRIDGNNGGWWYRNLCLILLRQGRITEAEAACRTAVRVQPQYPEWSYDLGFVLEQQKKYTEASAAYRTAVAADQKNTKYQDALKRVLAVMGDSSSDVPGFPSTYSPDRKLYTTVRANSVVIRDAVTNKELALLHGHTDDVSTTTFSPDGKLLATGSRDSTVIIWDVGSDKKIALLGGHTATVSSTAFSPDGKLLATGSYDKTVRIWDIRSLKLRLSLELQDAVTSVAFSADGRTIVAKTADGASHSWDAATGRILR